MDIRKCTGLAGEPRDYYLYPKAEPPYEPSDYIEEVLLDRFRYHSGEGDMWPMTWAKDGCTYCGAGDNKGCPTNIWRLKTMRYAPEALTNTGNWSMDMINGEPADLRKYMKDERIEGVKPSGLLDIDGKLYLGMEAQNYGDNPYFGRQHNLYGWILRSDNGGKTFDAAATETEFFTGRLASCHFLQFGRGYEGARDEYVYAYFPYDEEDGQSYWENNDALLLGRAPKEQILVRRPGNFSALRIPANRIGTGMKKKRNLFSAIEK